MEGSLRQAGAKFGLPCNWSMPLPAPSLWAETYDRGFTPETDSIFSTMLFPASSPPSATRKAFWRIA